MPNWLDRLLRNKTSRRSNSLIRQVLGGSFYKVSDLRGDSDIANIETQIKTMRALARDSQIATALAYYATDATVPNSSGQIIWATAVDPKYQQVEDIVNTKFKQWNINNYARDHILELATIGNLYLPTTDLFREEGKPMQNQVSLDSNSIEDAEYEIITSYKILPEDAVHLWLQGKPCGYIYQPDEEGSNYVIRYPEDAIIHFSLGGLLGDYSISAKGKDGEVLKYDIQFAQPLLEAAVQPTQALSLLEDSFILSSLTRIVRFINVECGNAEEDEIQATLQQVKDMIEQQLSINTATGDAQSYVNPQSPNNLIYVANVNGQAPIGITDMNMSEASEADNDLLNYYQDKKLSVLGVPKEAMNFSSAEGLGGAGAVMSQRSALYANSLQRIETAYIEGWRSAFNKYFVRHNCSGFVDKFELHMNPIVTQMSTVNFERRDSALSQASAVVDLLTSLGVSNASDYKKALTEILSEVLPQTGAEVNSWDVDMTANEEESGNF